MRTSIKSAVQNIFKEETRRYFNLVAILFLFTLKVFGQPQLIAPGANYDPYPITFTDDNQRLIVVTLTENVTVFSGTTGWTFQVGGVGVAALGPLVTGNTLTFQLPAGAITFAQRLNVRVWYNGTGNIKGNVSGLQLGTITNYQAINNLKWGCDGLTGVQKIGLVSLKSCAPTTATYSIEYSVNQSTRNSIYWGNIYARINFNDPLNANTTSFLMTESAPVGSGNFSAVTTLFTYQTQNVCSFFPFCWPVFVPTNGYASFNCMSTSARQDYAIPSYQLDNQYSGNLLVYPPIGDNLNKYCVGVDIPGHVFRDNTLFNCRWQVEPNRPNTAERIVQFVYGTNLNGGLRIPNIYIRPFGVPIFLTDPSGNPIAFPTPSGFYEGPIFNYDTPPLPGDQFSTYPTHQAYPIYHTGNYSDVAGMRFEVTLRMWGPCNIYDPFNPLANMISQNSYIELIAAPPAPVANNKTICVNDPVVPALSVNNVAGATFYWYSNPILTIIAPGSNNTNTYNTGIPNNPASTTTFYVTRVDGGVNGCVSQATPVTLTINPLIAGNTIGAVQTVCSTTLPALLTGSTPTGGTGAYTYQWQNSSDNVTFNNIPGATGINYAPPLLASSTWYRRIVTSGPCSNTSASIKITVTPLPIATFSYAGTPYCSNGADPSPTFSGGGVAGTFSSTAGLVFVSTLTGQVDLSASTAGTYTVTNTIAAAGGCGVVSATSPITITTLPAATISYSGTPFCTSLIGGQAVTRTGTAGGTYTASPAGLTINAATGDITPSSSTAGTYTVTYSIAAAGGCGIVTTTTSITITTLPAASISYVGSPWCSTAGVKNVTLIGTAGGTYTAAPAGLTINSGTGRITPSSSTAGTYTVTYTIAAAGGCGIVTATTSVTITTLPTATISYSGNPFCSTVGSGQAVTLTGTAGGSYTAAPGGLTINAASGDINPSTSTAGTYTVTYSIAAAGGCGVVTATTSVTITTLPAATISYAGSPYCTSLIGGQAVTRTGTAGGTYSSTAGLTINAGTGAITPSSSTAGTYTVTYSIAAAGGCGIVTATTLITITALPVATFSYTGTPYCISAADPSPTFSGGGVAGGFSSTAGLTINAGSGLVDLSTSTPATYTVTNTIAAAGGCAIVSATSPITIHALPTVNAGAAMASICQGGTSAGLGGSVGGSATGGTWSTPALGTFTPNATTLNATWTPPGAYSGTATLTLTTSGGACAPVSANKNINVEPTLVPGTISSNQSKCSPANPDPFTQITAASGGLAPLTYQWRSSLTSGGPYANIPGATLSTYDAPAGLLATTYYVRQVTSSGICGPALSNELAVIVNPAAPVSPVFNSGSNNVCYGQTGVNYAILTVPNATTYTWTVPAGVTITSGQGTISINVDYTPGTSSPKTISVDAENGCGASLPSNIIVNIYGNLTSGTIGTAQSICYNTAPAALTETVAPTGGTGVYTYQWQSSPDNSTWTSIVGATAIGYAPPVLTVSTYYRRQVTSGTCGTLPSGSILITVYGNLTSGTIGTAQSICYNTAPAALTETVAPTGGTGVYTYQWQSSPDNSTWTSIVGATAIGYAPPVLTVSTYYRRQVTSGTCGTLPSGSILITVYGNLTSGTIGTAQSICYNTAPAALTETVAPTGGTGVYTYQWQSSPDNSTWTSIVGATAIGYAPPVLTVSTYYRRQVTSGTCGTLPSGSILITVYGNLTSGTIGTAQSICYNTAPAALTETVAPTGGTGVYTYQWQSSPDNSTWTSIVGATAIGYAPPVLTVSTYYRRQVTSGTCGTLPSGSILITVYGNLTSGTIGTAQSICYNTAPAALTETVAPTGGTGVYTYQWQSSPDNSTWTSIVGATAIGYAPPVLTVSTYYRRQVTSGTCGTLPSGSILITVYGNLTSGTIGTAQSICYNTAPAALTETVAPTGGTGVYTYQWQSSPDNSTWTSIVGATAIGYAPPVLTVSTYYRRQVTSGTCGTLPSGSILITVYGNLTSGTIGTAQSICYNTAPAALTETVAPTGGTGVYTYQWQSSPDNSTWTSIVGATAIGYAPPVLTVSTYYRRQVTSGTCGTLPSGSILITVYGNLTSGTIGTAQSICYNTAPAALTETVAPTGGTGVYTYQWQSSPDNSTWTSIVGATAIGYAPPVLTVSTYYRRQVTSGTCGTLPSGSILITVYGNLTSGTIGTAQSICYNTAPAALTETVAPTGGTGVYTYQWQSSPDNSTWTSIVGATAIGYAPPVLTVSTYYRRQVTSGTCGTLPSGSILITVYGNLTSGTIGTAQSICYNTAPAALTETVAPTGGTGVYTYQWQSSPDNSTWTSIVGATAIGYAPPVLTVSTYYRRQVTSGTCGTLPSGSILITVYGNLTSGTIGTAQSICYNTAPAALTETVAPTGGTGVYTYQWQSSPDNSTWTSIVGATAIGYAPPVLTVSTYYRRQVTSGTCGTLPSGSILITIKQLPDITAGQNPAACSGNALSYQILMNNFTNPPDNVTFTWPAPVLNPVNPSFSGGNPRAVPSAANITDVFTNTLGVVGTARYDVTPFKNGCAGTPVSVLVSVGSEPVLDPGLNAFACSNTPIGLILKEAAGSVVPTYYNIISKTVAGGLTDVGNAIIPNGTAPAAYLSTDRYTNTSGINKTVTYRVQPILAPNCIGAAVDVVITIRPEPVIFPAQSKTVCSRATIGKEILLSPPNTPAGTHFNWPVPVISDASVQGTAGVNVVADPTGTLHINDQIHNYSAAPIQATYTVTPVSQFGCAGTAVPVIITINPEPIPQPISGRDKICVTDKNVVYNVTAVGGSIFHWTVDATVGTKVFDMNANAILIDAAAAAGSGNILVTETNSFGCTGDASAMSVQVYAQPVPEIIAGNAVVCANSTNIYSVTARAGSIYNWTVPGGAAILGDPSAASISVIFANVGGTILVRETNAAGCVTNHQAKNVTVNPLPTATISGGATICNGASRNLTVNFTGTGPYTFTYALNGVPQVPVATAVNPYTLNVNQAGTYTIVNVSDANCTNNGTGTTTVSFFPQPTGTISGTAAMCRGGSTTLTMTFTGVAPYNFTYTDGTTPVNVVGHLTNVFTVSVSPLVNTTYALTTLTDGNTCAGVVSGSAVISVNPPPVLTLTGTNLICYNVNTGAVNMAIAGGTAPFGFAWTGPSGFTANTQNISLLASGYYAVVVTDSKGCTGTANITLTQPPALTGSAAGTNITCFGANDGTITISGAGGGSGTYEFTVNGGAPWQASPNFTALTPGTYNVMMRDAVNPTCILPLNGALLLTQPAVLNAVVTKTDINCFGAANGSIVISAPTGGYGTYGYSIDGGATWQGSGNFTNLTAGSHNVRIRDAANMGCFVILSPAVIITEPVVLSATLNSTNVTCFGSTDGTITISAPLGGHGTYEYSINGGGSWQATGNYTGLATGNYNVQIRDAGFTGCFKVLNATLPITQPAVLQANVASTNVTCNAANDGIINITAPQGGYGTYEYSITGAVGWQGAGLFNALAPGTYDVRIRDAAHPLCFVILNAGLQITEPGALNATVIGNDITCFGANDGQIQITNSAGGYGTYDYSDNGGSTWQLTGLFTLLTPGNYNVQMRDRAHPACVKILANPLAIAQPAVLNATVNHTNVTCNGASDGTITISGATGGYGSYGYSINGGTSWQGSANFTNLGPGTYNIRIRDAVNTGCIMPLNPAVVITQPAALSATVVKTNVNCNGASDGTITISGTAGGYGTYEYTINGGAIWQGTGSFTGLIPGFYNVKIRDAANQGCIVTLNGSLNITEPPALNANVAKTNITCHGANNGTITITSPTGGYGTYDYSINGGVGWQPSGSFTALTPATYDVRIRDAAHPACVVILNSSIVITEPAILAATITSTNINCNGAADGTITISGATGGSGTYEYTVTGGTVWTGLNNFTNRAPGVYDVRIRDAANITCVVSLNAGLTLTQPPVLTATVAKTNINCFGSSNGTITISGAAGGYGTYEYSINGGGSWQGSGIYSALGPGNYNVQIRDAAHTSCVVVLNNSVQITQPAALTAVVTPTNVSCNGANNGIINITAPAGGSGTYDYSTDGGATWHPSGLFNGLIPATYNVQIRDAANPTCLSVLNSSVTITEPAVLNAVMASTNITCNGANDGTISVTSPTGGYGTFDYSDNGGAIWQATGNFVNLIPGTYNVQIRDKAHTTCVAVLDATRILTQPAALTATLASTNVTCFGANNGTITITNPLGGYGTYSYSVNGGASWQPTGIFTNLAPSTYVVRIRDAANIACEATLSPGLIITQPPVLSATVTSSNVTCNGAGDGTITIASPLGGYGTYEYSVTGGTTWQASGTFAGVIPGFYNVQIRDAANAACVVILNGSLQVTQPAALSAFVSKTNITCNGASDGTITIVGATGGYGTYEYSVNGTSWQASGLFAALAPATYNVQMRDAAHATCVKILDANVVITQPAVLAATVTPTMVTCSGANDGRITISAPTGGYGSYQFSITGGTSWQGSGTFTNLSPATYNVRMRDAGNITCAVILVPALVITEPVALSATLAHTNVTCFGGNDGTITISAPAGGYGTYEYSINGGGSWQISGNFTLLTPGSYNVLIRDAAHPGCVIVLNNSYAISQPAILAATVTKTDVSCRGANNGIINITAPTGGSGTYQYSVDGGGSWVGAGNFSNLVPATYDVRIRDAANIACSATLYPNLIITEPIQLALTSTGDIVLDCFNDLDGSGTFFGSGGTMPYNFHLVSNTTGAVLAAPGFNSQTFFNAGAGTIVIAVTDFHGCFAQATINITQPALLAPGTIAANQVVCAGTNPVQITETVPASGGPGAYNYQWQYSTTAVGPFINIAGASGTVYTPPAGANTTLYYRRMITSGICMPVYSNVVQVLVNPKPVAVLTGGETICPSQNSILKVNIMVGTGPFELDVANFGTITGYVSGSDIIVSPGTTTVYTLTRVRDANGCEVIAPSTNLIGSATVTVRDLPAITSSPVSKTICEFGMVAFSTVATGTDLTYQWYVNTGSGFNAVADGGVYFGATNSTLSLFGATRLMTGYIYHAVVTGCLASVTSADATLTVNTVPEISKQPRDSTVCMNAGATFNVTATGTALNYQWQVNKGTGFNNVVNDANFSGSNLATLTLVNAQAAFNNYIFRVIVSGSCGIPVFSNFAVLRVNIPPTVTLNPVSKAICDGSGPVIFSANGSGMIDSMRWEVFNGTAWSDVHDNAVYSGSTSQQLTLDQVPLALNGYLYRLALKAKCTTVNTLSGVLTVNPNPVVNFSAIDPIHACGSVPVVINGNPTGGSGTWASHLWTGDIGPLNNYFIQSPTFNSQIAGTYLLNYKVKDNKGCSANGNVTVLVDAPDATFTQDMSNGCTPLTVTFTKDMTGIASFSWDYGDGSPVNTTIANPVHIFTNANPASIEYYNVKLTVTSAGGCVDTYTSSVTVYPSINATFTATPATVCSGNQIVFTTLPGASKYFWDFGDGVSGYFTNTTNHLYTNFTTAAVVHTVTLTTTSFYNCTDVKTVNITVMPVPIPQFTAVPPTQEYDAAGNPVTFTNTTNAGTWNWLWHFGDGTTSTTQSPSHTYTDLGTYNVVLTVSNANCSDSVKHQVIVTPKKPIASFDLVPSGCSPLTITPNNTSQFTNTPGTTYMWDFGDGGASTSKNPTYTYRNAGTYVVKLTVSGPGGISTFIQTQLVNAYPSPFANFQVAPTTVFVNDEKVRMFNLSLGADSYLWEFGDGDTSKVKEPFHKYMEEGTYDITLWAYLHNVVNGVTITCSNKFVLSPGVTVEPSGVLKFSTVFTPNTSAEVDIDHLPTGGTEIDQFFFPGIREKVIRYKLQIFNRLGVLIFQSDDINKPWNGYYQHKLCPQGVYVWYVEGKYANGMPFKKVGDVTLLH